MPELLPLRKEGDPVYPLQRVPSKQKSPAVANHNAILKTGFNNLP